MPSTASCSPQPGPVATVASSPSALPGHHLTGHSRAPGGPASRAATSSSSRTSPAMEGREQGLSPGCARPAGPGWAGEAGQELPWQGQGQGQGRYLLVGKAVEHGHQEALQGEPGVSPPRCPSMGLGWAQAPPRPLLGAFRAEIPMAPPRSPGRRVAETVPPFHGSTTGRASSERGPPIFAPCCARSRDLFHSPSPGRS